MYALTVTIRKAFEYIDQEGKTCRIAKGLTFPVVRVHGCGEVNILVKPDNTLLLSTDEFILNINEPA